jgi:hypothetical protein
MEDQPNEQSIAKEIRQRALQKQFRLDGHAAHRMAQRGVTLAEVRYVLTKSGGLKPERTRFNAELNAYSYAFEGLSMDNRLIRVVVYFEDAGIIPEPTLVIRSVIAD